MNQTSYSITIHQLDPSLYEKLKQRAEHSNMSLNRLMKQLLAQAIGLEKSKKIADYSQFSHAWDDKDQAEFESSQKQFSTVDLEDWQIEGNAGSSKTQGIA